MESGRNSDRRRRAVALCVLALVVVGTAAPGALAHGSPPKPKYTTCVGPMGPVTVKGDLVVPDGAACQLVGTRVTGDVRVGTAASLTTSANAILGQDLACGPASTCSLTSTAVASDVTTSGTLTTASVVIGHDLVCAGSSCTLATTLVRKDAEVRAGTLSTTATAIGHDLTCAGASCTLAADTRIGSDVFVKAGDLTTNDVTVGQDVRCGGASCGLTDTEVRKDVVVTAGTLTADGGTAIGNDLVCGGASCTVTASSVHDDVDVTAGTFDSTDTTVGDDFTCGGVVCTITTTDIGGDATLRPGLGLLYSFASKMDNLFCDGATCNLDTLIGDDNVHSVVRDDVRAGKGAYVSARLTDIGDDVTCKSCRATDLFDSAIGGSVESIGQTQGGLYCNNDIAGSLAFSLNREYFITCGGNRIGGHLVLVKNGGVLSIVGNQVGETIVIAFNDTLETSLFANTAGKAIICEFNRPKPVGAGNSAPRVDRNCGDVTGPIE
jgi:hypothetical protein